MTYQRFDDLLSKAKSGNITEYEKQILIDKLVRMPSIKRDVSIMCCPYHNEKTPSFSVNRKDKTFRCFGCGVAGELILINNEESM